MAIKIKLKNSVTQDAVPTGTHLPEVGELAVNANINSIGGYMRASDNSIVKIFGPGSVSTPAASTTAAGIAELATSAETTTGTDTARVCTPAGVKAVTDAERTTSNNTYLALAGGTLTGVLAATAGSNSAPAIHFGDSDSGIYGGTNTVSLAAGGTQGLSLDSSANVSIPTSISVGSGANSATQKAAFLGGYTLFENSAGTGNPSITFNNDTDTGILNPGANILAFNNGGSETARIDASGRLLIGTSSGIGIANNSLSHLQMAWTDKSASIGISRFSANTAPPILNFGKARGGTIGTMTIVQENDDLGEINFCGADGTDLGNVSSRIRGAVDGTPGTDDLPGRLEFATSADGANVPTIRLTIDSAGLVNVPDSGKFTAGASDDLQIFHSGSHSYIKDTGTGDLFICSDDLHIGNAANDEDMAVFKENGSVELYYDNSKKFETLTNGAKVSGELHLDSNGSLIKENQLKFSPSGAAYIDHATTGQSVNFRVSNSSSLDTTALTIASTGATTFGGAVTAKKLTLTDDGASGPTFVLKTDDHSPWGFIIKNDTYSTSADVGLKSYQSNDGDFYLRLQGDSEYNNFYLRQHDGTTNRDLVSFNASGNATFAGDVSLPDNKKLQLGASQDLQIYHNGDSFITNTTATQFAIQSDNLRLRSTTDNENYIVCTDEAGVELYWDGSKKFETTSTGVKVTGRIDILGTGTRIDIADNGKIILGDSNDLQIYHSGSESFIADEGTGGLTISGGTLSFKNQARDETHATMTVNAGVELYYDNSLKFATKSYGVFIDGHLQMDDSDIIKLGNSNDLQIYHDGSDSFIKDAGSGNLFIATGGLRIRNAANDENLIQADENGAVKLYYDDVKQCETNSGGMNWADGKRAYFGNSSDLQIYHDGSNSYIQDTGTGELRFTSNTYKFYNAAFSETLIEGFEDGAVNLYYDGGKRVETTDYGLKVTGNSNSPNNANWDTNSSIITSGSYGGAIAMIDGSAGFVQYLDTSGANWHLKSAADTDTPETNIKATHNGAVKLYYDNSKKLETHTNGVHMSGSMYLPDSEIAGFGDTSNPDLRIYHDGTNSYIQGGGNDGKSGYAAFIKNDGNNADRYGLRVQIGADDASGTNYAMTIASGNNSYQGAITFSGGTVTYGTFTAYHPCIVPDSENPSDSSNAYPYGTLLETISIEYTQKNGANTERGIRYKVQKTQSANSRKVLGAYGSSMNGGPEGQTNEHQALVLGDGHILVNNAGGNIEVGDGICSSATAGIGQKATANPSMIIGIAQEAVTFTGSETKLVAVQYGLQQFIPWT